jgi:hypothetical protein
LFHESGAKSESINGHQTIRRKSMQQSQNANYPSDQTRETPSLISRSDALNGRLREIATRLERIADSFFGSVPQAVGSEPKAGPPINPSVQRHIDLAHNAASEIESVITRIENHL